MQKDVLSITFTVIMCKSFIDISAQYAKKCGSNARVSSSHGIHFIVYFTYTEKLLTDYYYVLLFIINLFTLL